MSQHYLAAPDRFETERFVLRSYFPGDGAILTEAVESSYDHLAPWMPWAQPSQPQALSEQLARQFRGRYLLATDFVIAVVSPGGDKLLGGTGFHLRHGGLESHTAEIGMWIRASEAGQGLGTAVLEAMLQWGFTQWPWERLVWHCNGKNIASTRTAQKAGLRLEGTLKGVRTEGEIRDTLLFGILKDEWGAQTPPA